MMFPQRGGSVFSKHEWHPALDAWERRSNMDRAEDIKASLLEAKKAYEALVGEQSNRIKRYEGPTFRPTYGEALCPTRRAPWKEAGDIPSARCCPE